MANTGDYYLRVRAADPLGFTPQERKLADFMAANWPLEQQKIAIGVGLRPMTIYKALNRMRLRVGVLSNGALVRRIRDGK